MSKLSYTQAITIITLLQISSCLSTQGQDITGQCLSKDLESLVSQGCNFNPNPQTLELLQSFGRPSEDFNFGQATYQEAIVLWQKPKFIAGYFKKAIANPKTPLSGEIAGGIQYFGDYTVIGMQNIHLCSDNGDFADYSITNTQILIETSKTAGQNKDDLRNAGWQLGCLNKIASLKKLLGGEKLTHSLIASE